MKVVHLSETDSTNAEVIRQIKSGDLAFETAIYADKQSSGRGRRGRVWDSPTGNLYCSLAKPVEGSDYALLPPLVFIAVLAVHDTVIRYLSGEQKEKLITKWPNDLLFGTKKLSGVLIETVKDKSGQLWSVTGIGLNLIGEETKERSSLFALTGKHITPDQILDELTDCYQQRFKEYQQHGFEVIKQAWLERTVPLGHEILVRTTPGGEKERMLFRGLNEEGAIVVESNLQEVRTIHVADILLPT